MTLLEEYVKLYSVNNNIDDIDATEEDYQIIEEGDFQQDHKIQYAEHIVKYKGIFIIVQESRSGSYHTDWYYDDAYIYEVERKEETKVVVTYKAVGEPVTVPSRY